MAWLMAQCHFYWLCDKQSKPCASFKVQRKMADLAGKTAGVAAGRRSKAARSCRAASY
jgi:hypothetical protein